jgi:hypothetical protein
VWSVPVAGLFFLGLVVGLGGFILVGPYAKAPSDLLSQIFTGAENVKCRVTGRDIAYSKAANNASLVEVLTHPAPTESCNLPAYGCCLRCSADALCLAYSKVSHSTGCLSMPPLINVFSSVTQLAYSKVQDGDTHKCRFVKRIPLDEVTLTDLQQDQRVRADLYDAAEGAKEFAWERVVGAISGTPLDALPSGNVHTYIHTCIHTYRQTDRQTDRHTCNTCNTYMHTCMHTCIYTHTQTHTHTHTHTDIHTHVCVYLAHSGSHSPSI